MSKQIIIAIVIIIILFGGGYMLFTSAPAQDSTEEAGGTATTTPMQNPTAVLEIPTGAEKTYSLAQVATHNSASSCWTVVDGSVYDLTGWIAKHPGGEKAILSLCGTDGTAVFEKQHGGKEAQEKQLATFKIGTLAQ